MEYNYEFGKVYGHQGVSGDYLDSSSGGPIITPIEKINRKKILEKGKTSENKTYVFSRRRNDHCGKYKWFPIGWAVNIHSLGELDDPPILPGEWNKGKLKYLIDSGCWWFNFIYTINYSNMEAWGKPYERGKDQWATTDRHVRLLEFLKKKKEETDGKIDIKVLFPLLSKTDDDLKLFLNGDWDGIPNNMTKEFITRVHRICLQEQLLGWMLSDEPYGGDLARQKGVRERNYQTLLEYKELLIKTDCNINYHPIYNVIRGNGNYDFDPIAQSNLKKLLNELKDIGDYILDDFYLGDFLNDGQNGNGIFLARIVQRTQRAMQNLIDNSSALNLKKAWGLFSQGKEFPEFKHPVNDTGYLLEEDLRYQNYAAWINGAQGCYFWELSKSDNFSFNNVKKISYEAYKCSKFLMEKIDDQLTEVKCYSENSNIQFIVRKDPQERILLMVCNNSRNDASCYFAFPESLKVKKLEPICFDYNWNYAYYNSDNYFKIDLDGLHARAFYVR